MKTIVIYHSEHGNTKTIAEAIGEGVGSDCTVLPVDGADAAALPEFDLLIAGSPTYGGRPTPPMLAFLGGLMPDALAGKKFAAFDTRITMKLVKLLGFAGGRIANRLKKKGAMEIMPPEGFYVTATEGPLKEGELTRAKEWGNMCRENGN